MQQAPAPTQEDLYGKDMILAPAESCATAVPSGLRPLPLLRPWLVVHQRQSMMRLLGLPPDLLAPDSDIDYNLMEATLRQYKVNQRQPVRPGPWLYRYIFPE